MSKSNKAKKPVKAKAEVDNNETRVIAPEEMVKPEPQQEVLKGYTGKEKRQGRLWRERTK